MNRLVPIHVLTGIFVLFAPALARSQPQSVILAAASPRLDGKSGDAIPGEEDLPSKLRDIIQMSKARYFEGSNLIQSGESAKARIAFDQAVDMILQSDYDLSTTPALNTFFLELIRNIQRDESRYLLSDEGAEEKPEGAVVDELAKVDLIPIAIDPALKDVVEADILNTKYDIPVVVNESVLKSMNFWSTRGRKYFIDGLSRSGRYQEMIERIFREESLPLDLMYLAQVESLFKTNALSRAQAKGIWQFSKGTAIRYGLKVNRYIDERSDPEKSTRAAARYLNDLYTMFNDWNLVLAAYNWGEGKIQRLVDTSGVKDFWYFTTLRRKMPEETKNHVPLILASIIMARNPEKYGLPAELEAPLGYDKVSITKRVNLKAASKALDISVDLLRKLNPALKTYYTPPDYPNFELNVPLGMGGDFAEKLAAVPAAEIKADPEFNGRYKIRAGDTLSSIAARYRVSVEDLQVANGLRSPKSLRAGAWLQVPQSGTAVRTAAAPRQASAFNGYHEVKAGETLASIGRLYGVTAAALQAANNIRSASALQAGASIKVPSDVPTQVSASAKTAIRRHQVKSGETLSSIAARYGITVAALQRANGIRSPRSLRAGVWLQIPSGKS